MDWHDAYVGPLIGELAWSAWEFGHDPAMRLVPETFTVFVNAYRHTATHLPDWEYDLIPLAVRIMLRHNVRAGITHGATANDDYQARQIAAFHRLRDWPR